MKEEQLSPLQSWNDCHASAEFVGHVAASCGFNSPQTRRFQEKVSQELSLTFYKRLFIHLLHLNRLSWSLMEFTTVLSLPRNFIPNPCVAFPSVQLFVSISSDIEKWGEDGGMAVNAATVPISTRFSQGPTFLRRATFVVAISYCCTMVLN